MTENSENTGNVDIAAEVSQLLAPTVTQLGLFLEKVCVKGSKNSRQVEIFLDLPAGSGEIGFERLEAASQEISRLMDSADLVEGKYNLEVSTLGAEHALDNPRLFVRAVGRDAEITVAGQKRVGRILAAGETGFTWEEDGKQETISFSALQSARTVVLFGTGNAPKKSVKTGRKNNRKS
ncbi:ribosome maturation factor RimP [Mobiluncus mulieris]|uniref:ribosome maturation factor RimP n=1 Tax=Mobiluncus mulieris TaxID=2052 RepID=UPI000DF8DB73|nr:ribosome assembly cofactor RimP [Mobiluncus mulieris]STY84388.1 ribosome maturation protein RimP [Mobiluncus mulieris]